MTISIMNEDVTGLEEVPPGSRLAVLPSGGKSLPPLGFLRGPRENVFPGLFWCESAPEI